jgi:hypothetical protein
MNTLEKRVTAKKARISRLDQRIGELMSQRVTEEETLAALIAQQRPPPAPGTTKNPVVTGGGQPFQGSQMVILEKRTSDGTLDFSQPQPPTEAMTFDGLYALYFRESDDSGSWENLRAWLDSKGWVVRAKTW